MAQLAVQNAGTAFLFTSPTTAATATVAVEDAAAAGHTDTTAGAAGPGVDAAAHSPLQHVTNAAVAAGASFAAFGRLVFDAMRSVVATTVEDTLRRIVPTQPPPHQQPPSHVAVQSPSQGVDAPDIAALPPRLATSDIILEPTGPTASQQAAEIASRFADSHNKRLKPPSGIALDERFLLHYGAYRSMADSPPLPPLWLVQQGNPYGIWGEW